ncbi:hypothetical protein BV20DRAFT_652082 [Pilatotrama ljubarskyi]|nr:hypothetical protein BV20DRAFT_652082 [Pilatotrama ljubarskyi]
MQSFQNVTVHNASDPQVVPRKKSPPPSFINLDDCKPIISTTTTNTSSNSSSNGTTAFVFTSSRTLRALQEQAEHRLSPGSPLPSSPGTPPTPSSTSSTGSRHRAQLTLSQLTKHSEGAIDARSLIGPKMRAAGFINLPHTLGSRSGLKSLGTPSSPSLMCPVSGHFPPTPSDPPNFPPIMFVNPSVVTTLPMWEYQRDTRWSFTSSDRQTHGPHHSSSSNEPTPGPGQADSSSMATHSPRRVARPELPGSHSSDSAGQSSSGSSSTLVSSGSSPSTGLTSVDETDEEEARDGSRKGKAKAKPKENEPSEYPFPAAYDPMQSPLSGKSCGSRASSATASPTVYSGPSATNPLLSSVCVSAVSSLSSQRQSLTAVKPPSPARQRRSSEGKRDKAKTKEKPAIEPTPSFASAKRPQYQRQYSLTELCDSSPYAWLTKSDMFAPPAPISRSPIRTSSVTASTLSISRPRTVIEAPPHRRHHTAPDKVPTITSERHHRIASAPLRMPADVSNAGSSDQSSESSGANRVTRMRTAAGGAESHQSTDGAAAPGMLGVDQGGGGLGPGTGARGRDTRGKVLGASESAKERTAAAEAELDLILEKATEDLTAMVLAHRERDREYARHVAADRERDKLVKQVSIRVTHDVRKSAQRSGCRNIACITNCAASPSTTMTRASPRRPWSTSRSPWSNRSIDLVFPKRR